MTDQNVKLKSKIELPEVTRNEVDESVFLILTAMNNTYQIWNHRSWKHSTIWIIVNVIEKCEPDLIQSSNSGFEIGEIGFGSGSH